jgi:hypothetical protein
VNGLICLLALCLAACQSGAPLRASATLDASREARSEHIRAVFAPDITLSALNELLSRTALSIISGPSDAGVYTLAFTDPHGTNGRLDQAIAALRANAQVKFAEPAVNDEAALR